MLYAGPKSQRKTNPVTWVVALVAILALAAGGYHVVGRRAHADRYNEIVQLIDAGKDAEAATQLEALIPDAPADVQALARKELAKCYVRLADAPANTSRQSAAFYVKANEHDPDVLTPMQRKMMTLKPVDAE